MDPQIDQFLRETLLPLTVEVVERSIADVGSIKFDKRHPQHLPVICVYATILELSRAELALLDTGNSVAFSPLLRSIFESYADLRALLEDVNYLKRMHATLIREKLRLVDIAERLGNTRPDLLAGLETVDVQRDRAEFQRQLNEYADQGHRALSNAARFDAGRVEPGHEILYWLLCLEGHNNIASLEERHVEKSESGSYEVTMFKERGNGLAAAVGVLVDLVGDASTRVHRFFGTDMLARHEALAARISEQRAQHKNLADAVKGQP